MLQGGGGYDDIWRSKLSYSVSTSPKFGLHRQICGKPSFAVPRSVSSTCATVRSTSSEIECRKLLFAICRLWESFFELPDKQIERESASAR